MLAVSGHFRTVFARYGATEEPDGHVPTTLRGILSQRRITSYPSAIVNQKGSMPTQSLIACVRRYAIKTEGKLEDNPWGKIPSPLASTLDEINHSNQINQYRAASKATIKEAPADRGELPSNLYVFDGTLLGGGDFPPSVGVVFRCIMDTGTATVMVTWNYGIACYASNPSSSPIRNILQHNENYTGVFRASMRCSLQYLVDYGTGATLDHTCKVPGSSPRPRVSTMEEAKSTGRIPIPPCCLWNSKHLQKKYRILLDFAFHVQLEFTFS